MKLSLEMKVTIILLKNQILWRDLMKKLLNKIIKINNKP